MFVSHHFDSALSDLEPVSKHIYLWSNIAQVEGVIHGFLAPLMIGCCSQVASVEATPPVVVIG